MKTVSYFRVDGSSAQGTIEVFTRQIKSKFPEVSIEVETKRVGDYTQEICVKAATNDNDTLEQIYQFVKGVASHASKQF